eukprot:gene10724-11872_t
MANRRHPESNASVNATAGQSSSNDDEEANPSDFICVICLQLLIEPVVLPCNHELCMPCFKEHVNSTSLYCPMCRIRISNWARKKSREGSLINKERWQYIQKLFPDRCRKRLNGEDDDDDDIGRATHWEAAPFCPVVAKQGELRKEYEVELQKIEHEREKEIQASEEIIQALLKEEEEYKKSLENDEKFAKELQTEELESFGDKCLSPNSKLKSVLNVLSQPKEMTLRSKSNRKISRKTPMVDNSKKCMSSWLSKSEESIDRCQFEKQEEEDYRVAFKLQKELDMEGKRTKSVQKSKSNLDEHFFTPKRSVSSSSEGPPSLKYLKSR